MKKDYQKPIKTQLDFFLFPLNLVSFYGQDYEKQKGPGASNQSLFGLQNMFRKIPFWVIYRLGNFDDLMQGSFLVIPKTAFANLCRPSHDSIIIPVSSDLFNLETLERKGKNWKSRCQWRRSGVFVVNFKHISHLFLVLLLLVGTVFENQHLIDC